MRTLKDILCGSFDVTTEDYEKAASYQSRYDGRIEQVLVNMGALAEDKLHLFYAEFLSLPLLTDELETAFVEQIESVNDYLTADLADWFNTRKWQLCAASDEKLAFVTADPLNMEVNQRLPGLNRDIDVYLLPSSDFERFTSLFSQGDDLLAGGDLTSVEEDKLRELASEAPTVSLLNSLITRALREGASDMHIEPLDNKCQVRFRVDGVLKSEEYIPASMQLPVITRIKILSGMDIAEKRRPQDGKIELKIAQQELDIRVSSLPLNMGESVVMRFLRKDALEYDMEHLGLAADVQRQIEQDLKTTAGVILLTGPTGSGKTTSLYTFLSAINSEKVKIITLEDPVEYQLDGVNQVQVRSEIGFDFAAGLRSIVRQDPDVIMVGEIRDQETARIALQSAITGHLVFSTVHTNDAPSAYTRLLDLGVEEFLLNAALVSIIAQRLVRTYCSACSAPVSAEDSADIIDKFGLQQIADKYNDGHINLHKAVGCETCNHTGYKGRKAVIEYFPCDEAVRTMPKDNEFLEKARKHNQSIGNRTMVEDGLLKVVKGITSIDEVMRVAG